MIAQDTLFYKNQSIKFSNRILDLSSPAVMGIVNLTPDSFYDGGKYSNEKQLLENVEKMILDGADIIDLGACSTRPNAEEISTEEELSRLLNALKKIRKEFQNAIISIDTYQSEVAKQSIAEGADMINDVSGGAFDKKMIEVIARTKVPYVLMHMQGTPKTMQQNPEYIDVVGEVKDYFNQKIEQSTKLGINQIIIDPGFGFGKSIEHNYSLLKNLSEFKSFGLPILAGISRKSMINKTLHILPEKALNGTTALNMTALLNGANIIRVHDVKEAKEVVTLFNKLK